ncbi:MAG: M28 family metallopeptidase [Gemmatimonadaceae bacterium]
MRPLSALSLTSLLAALASTPALSHAQAPLTPIPYPLTPAANPYPLTPAVSPLASRPSPLSPITDSIIKSALSDSSAYRRLALLTDTFGNRLSGSAALERTIDWVLAEMRRDGLEKVHSEPVMVPHWVRGAESAELETPVRRPLRMLGLGGSVGTPARGITAPVIVVSSFDELTRRAAEAKGHIVLFDVPFTSYRETVAYRALGATAAARVGAVASFVRSVTPMSLRTPHTGGLRYDSTVRKIPHAALTVEDAMLIHRLIDRGERVVVTLRMGARTLPDAPSRNVVAELTGSEKPDEVVVVGGHIDSWDVGAGAMDDGGGSVAAWEAVRLLKRLGLRPRRTVRVVLWTNEENGLRGGEAYRAAHASELDKHVLAIESDDGVFKPTGFGITANDSALAMLRGFAPLFARLGAGTIHPGESGADISPLVAAGVPGAGLEVDGTRYFWYHHTEADTIDKLDPGEMSQCVAALAVLAWTVADLPQSLPHGARPAR